MSRRRDAIDFCDQAKLPNMMSHSLPFVGRSCMHMRIFANSTNNVNKLKYNFSNKTTTIFSSERNQRISTTTITPRIVVHIQNLLKLKKCSNSNFFHMNNLFKYENCSNFKMFKFSKLFKLQFFPYTEFF
jgi:hypothetical protein